MADCDFKLALCCTRSILELMPDYSRNWIMQLTRNSLLSHYMYLLLFLIILAACLRDSILCPSIAIRTSLAITPAEYAGESTTMVSITMVFPSSSSLISLLKVRPNEISLLSRLISICKVHNYVHVSRCLIENFHAPL